MMRPLLIHYAAQPGPAACGADAKVTSADVAVVSCLNCQRTSSYSTGELFDEFYIETDEVIVDV